MVAYYYQRTTAFESETCPDRLSTRQMEREALAVAQFCDDGRLGGAVFCEDASVPWVQDFADRETGRLLLERLQSGDTLIAWSIERIFSSCQDTLATVELLADRGVHVQIMELGGDIGEPGFSRDVSLLLRVFAGLERRRAAERIKQVKHEQRQRGRFLGGSRPFGYMVHENGRLLENPMEQRVLKRIMQLKKQGLSLRAIAKEVSTPMVPISFKTVQRVLQRHA